MNNYHTDQQTRRRALDPTQSFIVQAPAGSGKTELLIQRYLVLLANVNKTPEEIIAITFTRKAAAEMRERVLVALNLASKESELPKYRKLTHQLARAVMKRDHQERWNLQENPNRLRILTIDALCARLCAQLPLLSRFGAQPKIIENPMFYYQKAVENILIELDNNPPWRNATEKLLTHLDNRVYQLQELLTQILAKRNQWLPHIIGHHNNSYNFKKMLQQSLCNVLLEKMEMAKKNISIPLANELIPLANLAGQYFQENQPNHSIAHCAGLKNLPDTHIESFTQWLGLAQLLLTKNSTWRKTLDKRCGFPAKNAAKEHMLSLLANINDHEALRIALADIQTCPPIYYSKEQWQILEALLELLPLLTAQLTLVFHQYGVVDFVELNLAALRALGTMDNPTDLALYLDHQIQHVLVDEFQDTSVTQYELLEHLLAGWQAGDGRTLFLVGDPMQSIYRFRDAEVGLFLRAKKQGIANVPLEFLSLQMNFRAQPQIVTWINHSFEKIFPTSADIALGAIPYTPAVAAKFNKTNGIVQCHTVSAETDNAEAQCIIDIISQIRKRHPEDQIAILVRSRHHLTPIINTLHKNSLRFRAVEIEGLYQRMEIQDLVSLTRALLHRGDRIAWLAILRAPWCGLTLRDLHCIAQHAGVKTIWESLFQWQNLSTLSEDAKIRLNHIVSVLSRALNNRGRSNLSQWIKDTWVTLRGAATLENSSQLNNIDSFFNLIQQLEDEEGFISLETLDDRLQQLYADPDPEGDEALQIMTIHKAKGLEFDHVILPGLSHKTPNEKNQILMWQERPNAFGSNDLLLAPIHASTHEKDPIYQYLRRTEKQKLEYEMTRLFYVATTRAKQSLHLIISLQNTENQASSIKPPVAGSFSEMLWPLYQTQWSQLQPTMVKKGKISQNKMIENNLRRLTLNWQPPILLNNHELKFISQKNVMKLEMPFDSNRIIGTVIHEYIEQFAEGTFRKSNYNYWRLRLLQLGLAEHECDDAIKLIRKTQQNMQEDPRAQWILNVMHQDARNEYPLTAVIENEIVRVVIDRCFIDRDGTRWIIDYKTSTPGSLAMNEFLQSEREKYNQQLDLYAKILQWMESRPMRLGLYFPLCKGWVEWEA